VIVSIRHGLSLVGDRVPFVGKALPLISQPLALIGGGFPQISALHAFLRGNAACRTGHGHPFLDCLSALGAPGAAPIRAPRIPAQVCHVILLRAASDLGRVRLPRR
jgi:hypothetical protein